MEQMAKWKVYNGEKFPSCTHCASVAPYARYRRKNGVHAHKITNYCPCCGVKMTAMDECANCPHSSNGGWQDNGICFACREGNVDIRQNAKREVFNGLKRKQIYGEKERVTMKKTRKDSPVEIIEHWMNDGDCDARLIAMYACEGRDVPLEIIEKGMKDRYRNVREAAMEACEGRDVPLEIIEKGMKDRDGDVRKAAMELCRWKDVPFEIIERGLKDKCGSIRKAAVDICREKGIPLPLIRSFEPPELVYKKCIGGVIVAASIPKDAQVRGNYGRKCRANKAVIQEIFGDFCGEKVGISTHDNNTVYFAGDEVFIEDFDMSGEACSTGFHFFCTREEAEAY